MFLHIANTLLLFFVFKWMTGAFLQSAFAAALFALHPLHVETVAWIADRKDVLSTFFWMLTMLAYIHYSRSPGVYRYLLVLLFFFLGMMAKSMVVTLPCVLLLMDYWPLQRLQTGQSSGKRGKQNPKFLNTQVSKKACFSPAFGKSWFLYWFFSEKAGFFIFVGISAFITVLALQSANQDVNISNLWSTKSQIANALVSYVSYIGKMIWPVNLIIYYPDPDILPVWQTVGAGLLLLCHNLFGFLESAALPLPSGRMAVVSYNSCAGDWDSEGWTTQYS